MLTICDSYASDYSISFNASKSKCLVVLPNSRRSLRDYVTNCIFYVCGKPIEYVDSFSHLGHIITSHLSDAADINNRRNNFVGQVNSVLCFFNNLNSSIKYKLFQSYCMSIYGCELWSLSNVKINDLCIAWRKSLHRVWELPYNTHCYILPLLSQCLSLFDEICSRLLRLLHNLKLVSEVSNYAIRYGCYRA